MEKINLKNDIFLFLISFIIFIIAYNEGIINLIIDKYTYRTETTSLLTGRDYLWSFYFNSIFDSIKNLLIGNSLTYYPNILNPGQNNDFFTNFIAHNTYLDIIVSWGIIGTCIYIIFVKKIIDNFNKTLNNKFKVKNNDFYICGIVYLMSLMALSYLGADAFAIILLYLLMLKYSLYEDKENLNEKK